MWEKPEKFFQENIHTARASVERSVKDVTAYTQLYPEKALLWAAGGGYVLRMLPLTRILHALVRVILLLLKPVALFYGASKLWQKAEPFVAPRTPRKAR